MIKNTTVKKKSKKETDISKVPNFHYIGTMLGLLTVVINESFLFFLHLIEYYFYNESLNHSNLPASVILYFNKMTFSVTQVTSNTKVKPVNYSYVQIAKIWTDSHNNNYYIQEDLEHMKLDRR